MPLNRLISVLLKIYFCLCWEFCQKNTTFRDYCFIFFPLGISEISFCDYVCYLKIYNKHSAQKLKVYGKFSNDPVFVFWFVFEPQIAWGCFCLLIDHIDFLRNAGLHIWPWKHLFTSFPWYLQSFQCLQSQNKIQCDFKNLYSSLE